MECHKKHENIVQGVFIPKKLTHFFIENIMHSASSGCKISNHTNSEAKFGGITENDSTQ